MRAYATDGFGEPGSIRDVPDPEPGEGQVLVRTKAAGVSTTDLWVMAGALAAYVEHVFPLIPGIDGSGVVERLGPGVDGFAIGDEVFGWVRSGPFGRGTWAEMAAFPADGLALKPAKLLHEQAAIIPHVCLTAAAAVDAADLGEGKSVVIIGAAGGVSSFATQFASQTGARVIGVTHGDAERIVRMHGCDDVIDYEKGDSTEQVRERYPDGVDVLLDLAPTPGLASAMAANVRDGGKVISVIMPVDVDTLAARGVESSVATRYAAEHRFAEIIEMIVEGRLRLPYIKTYPFDDIQKALDAQAAGHVHGKAAVLFN
jgi:NADPH:quinone reductase